MYFKQTIALCLLLCFGALYAAASPTVIPEVHAQPTKKAAPQDHYAVQTTSFTKKKIAASPAAALSDFLQQEQSIARVINNTNDNSQLVLSIRGFGDNAFANTLIVVDGFPLTNPSMLAPSMHAIALSDIAHIDILQGSEGSRWGNQAVGGVVKMETRHPEKPFAYAQVSYGSYHRQLYTMQLGSKFKNGLFFKLLGFSNDTDNYRAHNQQNDAGMSLQMGRDYTSGSLTVDAKIYDSRIDLPGGLTQQQYESNPRQASNRSNFSHFQTQLYQLTHKQALRHEWLLETRLSHSAIQGDGFVNGHYLREETSDTVNPVLTGKLFKTKLLFGYQGQSSDYQLHNTSMLQKAEVQQNDLYAQAIFPLHTKWDFTLGGRTAWQDNQFSTKNNNRPSATLLNHSFVSTQTLTYHPSSAWEVFVRRDGNFRFPKANELTALDPSIHTLLPQTGVSYEMGTKWHTPRQTTQLSAYRLQLENEIAYDPTQTAAAPFGSFGNFDTTLRYGMTLAEVYPLTDTILLDGQVNYVDARFAAGIHQDREVPAVPALNGNIGLHYQFTPQWNIKYTALYTGSRYASQDVENIGQKLSSYWLSGIALQYRRKLLSFHLAVENLFNQRYAVYTLYNTNTQANTYYPGTGRSLLFTVKLASESV